MVGDLIYITGKQKETILTHTGTVTINIKPTQPGPLSDPVSRKAKHHAISRPVANTHRKDVSQFTSQAPTLGPNHDIPHSDPIMTSLISDAHLNLRHTMIGPPPTSYPNGAGRHPGCPPVLPSSRQVQGDHPSQHVLRPVKPEDLEHFRNVQDKELQFGVCSFSLLSRSPSLSVSPVFTFSFSWSFSLPLLVLFSPSLPVSLSLPLYPSLSLSVCLSLSLFASYSSFYLY